MAQELEPQWNNAHCASTGLRYRRSIQCEGEEGTAVMSHSVSLLCTLLRTIIRTHFSALENKVGSELCRNESATLVTVRTEEELEVLKEYMSEIETDVSLCYRKTAADILYVHRRRLGKGHLAVPPR